LTGASEATFNLRKEKILSVFYVVLWQREGGGWPAIRYSNPKEKGEDVQGNHLYRIYMGVKIWA